MGTNRGLSTAPLLVPEDIQKHWHGPITQNLDTPNAIWQCFAELYFQMTSFLMQSQNKTKGYQYKMNIECNR